MNKNTIKPEMTVEAKAALQEIYDNNRLIAYFMGYTESPYENLPNKVYKDNYGVHIGQLTYHSSWDSLMPVIEKISQLNLPDPDGSSEDWQPFPRTFGMINDHTGCFMFRFNRYGIHEAPKLIDAAYLAVVEFLELEAEEKGGSSE